MCKLFFSSRYSAAACCRGFRARHGEGLHSAPSGCSISNAASVATWRRPGEGVVALSDAVVAAEPFVNGRGSGCRQEMSGGGGGKGHACTRKCGVSNAARECAGGEGRAGRHKSRAANVPAVNPGAGYGMRGRDLEGGRGEGRQTFTCARAC